MVEGLSSRLRVVHTESSLGWGGQEIRILTEAAGMLERGHSVTLLAPQAAPIYDDAKRLGVPVIAMPIAHRSFKGVSAVRSWLQRNPAEIVNTHSSTDSWLVALARASLGQAPPQVRTRHISAPVSRGWASRWLYTRATDFIVTTGESLARTLTEYNGFPADRIVSVPTGIDLRRFDPGRVTSRIRQELGIGADAQILTIVATLRSWKGHSYLLDAFAALGPRHPSLHLLIAGDGPQRTNLQEQIERLRLGNVHMLGRRSDIPEILAGSDLFVLPSWANEGVPQAVLQAMAMGLPVISTPVGAIDEAVVDGETGRLVPPKSSGALEEAISALLGDPRRRAALGTAGRRRVEAFFSLDTMLDRMEHVFQATVCRFRTTG